MPARLRALPRPASGCSVAARLLAVGEEEDRDEPARHASAASARDRGREVAVAARVAVDCRPSCDGRRRARRRSRCRRSRRRRRCSSTACAHELAVGRRRRRDLRLAGERDQPDADALRHLVRGTSARRPARPRAASASRRVACIEPETSTTRITVARSDGDERSRCGRASRDAERREREQEQRGRDVAPPRPAAGDATRARRGS